ncbi:MAG: hypothetical protein KJ574_05130 [Nanoarchaeota archaeon]|nr:hypothetical protein [Nanoarchaeota archaeon]
MDAKDLYHIVEDRTPVMEVVPTKKVNDTFYANPADISELCRQIAEQKDRGVTDPVLLSLLVQTPEAPLMLRHGDGKYDALSHPEHIEAYRREGLETFNGRVIYPASYTEMVREDKEHKIPWQTPHEGWNVMMRTTSGVNGVIVAKRNWLGSVVAMVGDFSIDDRHYTINPTKGGVAVMLNTHAAVAKEQYRPDMRRIWLALDSPQLKGRLVKRMRNILEA